MPQASATPVGPKTPQPRGFRPLFGIPTPRSIAGPKNSPSSTTPGTHITTAQKLFNSASTPSTPVQLTPAHQSPAESKYVSVGTIKSYGNDCINTVVGNVPHQRTFSIHAEHIAPRSRFFEDATPGSTIHLPDDNPRIFALYVHYLYTGHLAVLDYPTPVSASSPPASRLYLIAHLYVLAEKLEDATAKRAFLDALVDETDKTQTAGGAHFPGNQVVNTVYDGTMSGSPARKLLVDLYTCNDECFISKTYEEEEWPVEFLRDLEVGMEALGREWVPRVEWQSPRGKVGVYLEEVEDAGSVEKELKKT